MSSYNAIVSTLVHFETFRNIDLLHQGLYYLTVQFYSENSTGVGLPLDMYTSPYANKVKKTKLDYHNILPASISDLVFTTKTFTIRYCEEEVELNDICEFRIEVPVALNYLETSYVMEVQLHFGELTKMGGVEKLAQSIANLKELVEFKQVASRKFKMKSFGKGASQYVRFQSDGAYYGICNMTLHTTIIDFRYRIVPCEAVLAMRKPDGKPAGASKAPPIPAKPKTLGDFLFSNPDGSLPTQVSSMEVDRIYSDYVKVMMSSYEKVKERFVDTQKRCLTDKQKRDNCILLMCQDLVLPGDEGDEELFALHDDLPADLDNADREEEKDPDPFVKEEDQSRIKTEHEELSECNISNEVSRLENYKKLDLDLKKEDRKEDKKERGKKKVPFEDNFLNVAGDMDEHTSNNIVVPSFKANQRSLLDAPAAASKVRPKHSLKTTSQDPYKCAAKFALNITLVSGQILELWHKYIELITITPRFVTEMLCFDYHKAITTQKWGQCVLRTVIYTKDFADSNNDVNIAEVHSKMARQRRTSLTMDHLPVEEITAVKSDIWPVMFEQIYIKMAEKSPIPATIASAADPYGGQSGGVASDKINGIHLIVLVHGFQGNSYDMRVLKNNLSVLHPEALFLCSCKNEGKTEEDIQEMGTRLAQEVIDFVQEWCPGSTLGMLSFIGHSLGGLVIRAALPYLKAYQEKMETLITLSSPHLGYMYASNTIVEAGIWVLKQWRQSKSLEQLTLSDAKDYHNTFLYKVSMAPGMAWFKNVLLVSSYQDHYVPVESARIELNHKAIDDSKKGPIYIEITKNILSSIKAERLYRIDLDFVIREKSLDSWIGRTAHIQFLENDIFMKIFTHRYTDFFN